MVQITEEKANAFADNLSSQFSICLVRKEDTQNLKFVQNMLSDLGLPDFLHMIEVNSFTVGPFVHVKNGLSPEEYFYTCVYEFTRSRQWGKDKLSLPYYYVTSEIDRIRYEVQAWCSVMEVRYYRTNEIPMLDELVDPLKHNAFGIADLELAKNMFASNATSLSRGIVSTEIGVATIEWMRKNAQELLQSPG